MATLLSFLAQSFQWFLLYSFAGWFYETLLCSIRQKRFVNRGFLNGPYCPIYGWGAVLDILALGKLTNPFLLFVLGALLNCSLEYLTSFAMEKLFHMRWWDYSNRKFQLNGRVCLQGALVFGAFAVLLLKVAHPLVLLLLAQIPAVPLTVITAVLFLLFLADNIITFAGFIGFEEKLHIFSAQLEQRREAVQETLQAAGTEAAEKISRAATGHALLHKLNYQQKRMLRAFPKLKARRGNAALAALRAAIGEKASQRRKAKKR